MIERTKDDLFSQNEHDFRNLTTGNAGARKDNKFIKEGLKREHPADFDLMHNRMEVDITPPMKRIKRVDFARNTDIIENEVEMTGGDQPPKNHKVSRGSPPAQERPAPLFSLWSNSINPDEIDIDSSGIDTADDMDLDNSGNKPAKVYSEHVQMLLRKFPQMSQELNTLKERVTALDMWKKHEDRQADLAAFV